MNAALVKASKAVKATTSTVRSHLDAVERAREIYLNQIKRAEADYFERITRATAIITGEEAANNGAAAETSDATPTSPQPASA